MKAILSSLMLMSATADKNIKTNAPLLLEQKEEQHQLTTNNGILSPSEVIKLQVKQHIVIYLADGTKFSGVITKTDFKNKDHFECFGEIYSHQNTGFGFVLTKEGVFAGAIVMRNSNTTYKVAYDKNIKGYILIESKTSGNLL